MAVYYLASIPPVAYPAFYNLCDGRLPDTFEEWRVLEDLARRDLVASGHHFIGLPVEHLYMWSVLPFILGAIVCYAIHRLNTARLLERPELREAQ